MGARGYSGQPCYEVGEYTIHPHGRKLSSPTHTLELHWRSYEALRLLIEARGEVVPRDEFFQRLWPNAVVDETNLAKCISQLRKSLNNGDGVDYIETLPRVGYRLTVPVKEIAASEHVRGRNVRRWLMLPAAAFLLACCGFGWQWYAEHRRWNQAEEFVRQGEELVGRRTADAAIAATARYQRALEIQPKLARAYALMAFAINRSVSPSVGKLGMTALEAAEKGIAVDPGCVECQGALGFFAFFEGWQWDRGERYLRKALAGNRDKAGTRNGLAMLLAAQGRFTEALEHSDAAIAAGPYDASRHTVRSSILYFMGRHDDAVAAAGRAISLDPNYRSAWEWRSRAFLLLGSDEQAFATLAEKFYPEISANLNLAFRRGGRDAALRLLVQHTSGWNRDNQSFRRAIWLLLLGDHEKALDEMEVAVGRRSFYLMYLGADPVFRTLKDHPRYRALLDTAGLAKYFPLQSASRQ